MIGRLTGQLIEKHAPTILLDIQGVGYEIDVSMSTLYQLPECGESLSLHIHLLVREDAQLLYGFFSLEERQLFRTLIKTSGVGARLALAILSGMNVADFIQCVQQKNTVGLQKLPGIGKKTAERLVLELSDKLPKISSTSGVTPETSADIQINEAVSALVALGYKQVDASKMVNAIKADHLSSEDLIRFALKATLSGKR